MGSSSSGSIYGMSPYSTSPLSVSGGGSAYLYQVIVRDCRWEWGWGLGGWLFLLPSVSGAATTSECVRAFSHPKITRHGNQSQHHHDRERQGLRMHRSDSQSRNMGAGAAGAPGLPRTRYVCVVIVVCSSLSVWSWDDGRHLSPSIISTPHNQTHTNNQKNSSFSKDPTAAAPHDGNPSQLGPAHLAQYPSSHPSTASFHTTKKPVLLPVQDCGSWKRDDQYWLLPAVMAACRCVLGWFCVGLLGGYGSVHRIRAIRADLLVSLPTHNTPQLNSDELTHDAPASSATTNHHHHQEGITGGSDTSNSLLAHALSVYGDLEAGKVRTLVYVCVMCRWVSIGTGPV